MVAEQSGLDSAWKVLFAMFAETGGLRTSLRLPLFQYSSTCTPPAASGFESILHFMCQASLSGLIVRTKIRGKVFRESKNSAQSSPASAITLFPTPAHPAKNDIPKLYSVRYLSNRHKISISKSILICQF